MPMLPRLNFNVIDVRDCALAHITAMTLPEAAGNRHILAHCQAWLTDMAQVKFNSRMQYCLEHFLRVTTTLNTLPAPLIFVLFCDQREVGSTAVL